jgi:hypothetical protein
MAKRLLDQKALGSAVIARCKDVTLTGDTAVAFEGFKTAHAKLLAADAAVEVACGLRDAALAEVGAADAVLDLKLSNELPAQLIGAKLGDRRKPFGDYSKYSPSALTGLAFLKEVAEVRTMVAKIAKKGPPEELTRLLGECLQQAATIEQAVLDSNAPQRAHGNALDVRDLAAMDWSKAFARFKARAQVAFEEKPEEFKRIFEEVRRIDRPVSKRGRKKLETEVSADPK